MVHTWNQKRQANYEFHFSFLTVCYLLIAGGEKVFCSYLKWQRIQVHQTDGNINQLFDRHIIYVSGQMLKHVIFSKWLQRYKHDVNIVKIEETYIGLVDQFIYFKIKVTCFLTNLYTSNVLFLFIFVLGKWFYSKAFCYFKLLF